MQTGITHKLVPNLNRLRMGNSLERLLKDQKYFQIKGANVRERILKIMDPHESKEILVGVYKKNLTGSSQDFKALCSLSEFTAIQVYQQSLNTK